jgi:hypothetical protein
VRPTASRREQKYVHARGGDRAIHRNYYDCPLDAKAPSMATTRHPEFLSPERGAAPRDEFAPVRSYQDSLNERFNDVSQRLIIHVEGALRVRVTHAELDYVLDERCVDARACCMCVRVLGSVMWCGVAACCVASYQVV